MIGLEENYKNRFNKALISVAANLKAHLNDLCSDLPHVDRISARAKSIERFISKASAVSDGRLKYDEPLEQIQDQIGARIIVFYKQDVDFLSRHMEKYLRYVESREVEPENLHEFSYFGRHYVCLFPDDVIRPEIDGALVPGFFELQIKTVFQHAWSEASHDLGYKAVEGELSKDDRRALAFASAQAWGADKAFEEIYGNVLKERLLGEKK